MPRSLQEIIEHAEELADRFEHNGDHVGERADGTPLRALMDLIERRGRVESEIRDAVVAARDAGTTWSALGAVLGTSGEAVRQRYDVPVRARR